MQIDRVIKKIKSGDYLSNANITTVEYLPVEHLSNTGAFPITANIKVQLLKVFDLIGCAAKLKDITNEYTKQTGKVFNLRENVRSLHA